MREASTEPQAPAIGTEPMFAGAVSRCFAFYSSASRIRVLSSSGEKPTLLSKTIISPEASGYSCTRVWRHPVPSNSRLRWVPYTAAMGVPPRKYPNYGLSPSVQANQPRGEFRI